MGTKHIPQRTCIACRTVRAKRDLVRIVRTDAHHVQADPTGKKAGRGAYLCRQRECWESILQTPGRLENALKLETALAAQDLAQLREFAATLPTRAQVQTTPTNTTKWHNRKTRRASRRADASTGLTEDENMNAWRASIRLPRADAPSERNHAPKGVLSTHPLPLRLSIE